MFESLSFLAIGHFTHDVTSQGFIVGGAAAYSSITVRNLGAHARVVTSVGPEFDLTVPLLDGIQIHAFPSPTTTTFENRYDAQGRRTQRILGVASNLGAEAIPPSWRMADVVYLCPVANEVDVSVAQVVQGTLIGATPQGWMRRWDASGRVWASRWEKAERFLQYVDVLILSEEDLQGYPADLERYIALTPRVILTRGARGATLFEGGRRFDSPAYPAEEKDPTGAGDVFAAAFLLHLAQERDPLAAMNFAHCVASFAVEDEGTRGIPTLEQVHQRLSF